MTPLPLTLDNAAQIEEWIKTQSPLAIQDRVRIPAQTIVPEAQIGRAPTHENHPKVWIKKGVYAQIQATLLLCEIDRSYTVDGGLRIKYTVISTQSDEMIPWPFEHDFVFTIEDNHLHIWQEDKPTNSIELSFIYPPNR